MFVGAGRWLAKARRSDPRARQARLHLEITNGKLCNHRRTNLEQRVRRRRTCHMLPSSAKHVVAFVSQSDDRAL